MIQAGDNYPGLAVEDRGIAALAASARANNDSPVEVAYAILDLTHPTAGVIMGYPIGHSLTN